MRRLMTIAALGLSGLAIAQTVDYRQGLEGLVGGSREVVQFRYSAASSGPLIADTPNTVAHVTWNGTALVDSKGNTWTQNGTVPQVATGPRYPNGFASAASAGAGPFSTSNYYSVAPASVVNFAAPPFSICAVFMPAATTTLQALFNTSNASSNQGYVLYVGGGSALKFEADNGITGPVGTANAIVAGALNIGCGGRDASGNSWVRLNGGTTASLAQGVYTQQSVSQPALGYSPATGVALNGQLYEVWISSDTPSDALFTSIEQRVLNEIADTGQTLTVSRASTATYLTNGALWTAPNNVPRIEGFTDGGGGLLVEGPATNIVLASGDLSNVAWSTGNVTASAPVVTGNVGVAPDGTTTAASIAYPTVANDGASVSIVYQSPVVSGATTYTWSLYLRTVSGAGTVYLIYQDAFGAGPKAATACAMTTAWSRCALMFTSSISPGTAFVKVGFDSRLSSGEGNASPLTIYATFGQLETSPAATSYIPTAGTSVTRAADVISVANPATMTAASSWCIGATVTPYANRAWSSEATAILSAGASHGGANSVESSITTGLADTWSIYDATPAALTASYTLGDSNPVRLVQCDTGGTLTQYVNGALVSSTKTGTGTGIPGSNPATLYLGSLAGGGTSWANGYLTDVTVCTGVNGGACQ